MTVDDVQSAAVAVLLVFGAAQFWLLWRINEGCRVLSKDAEQVLKSFTEARGAKA